MAHSELVKALPEDVSNLGLKKKRQLQLYKVDCWKFFLCKFVPLNVEWEQHGYAKSNVSMSTD